MEKITADWQKIMEDGADAASFYLGKAIGTQGTEIAKTVQELAEELPAEVTGGYREIVGQLYSLSERIGSE